MLDLAARFVGYKSVGHAYRQHLLDLALTVFLLSFPSCLQESSEQVQKGVPIVKGASRKAKSCHRLVLQQYLRIPVGTMVWCPQKPHVERAVWSSQNLAKLAQVDKAWIPTDSEHLQLAEDGFDPSTSGLWAQHASAAPLCSLFPN